jgi:hypothetical protein
LRGGSAVQAACSDAEWVEAAEFQETPRQVKKDGVKREGCLYAVKVMGLDKSTILTEIDPAGNGFVAVLGYLMPGYAVVRIP